MATQTKLDFEGLEAIQTLIEGILSKTEDWSEAGDIVGDIVRDDFMMRFQSSPSTTSGGSVWGGTYWRALDEGYLMSNPRRKTGQVLIDTGELMRAFTRENATGNLTSVTEDTMEFGVNLDILPHAERLQETWAIAFWHPALLEKISAKLTEWYIGRNK